MIFQGSITIPANTTKENPTVVTFLIDYGIITEIKVRSAFEHAGLTHCTINYHEQQIAPQQDDMYFTGDGQPIDFAEFFEIYQPPFELKIKGWNDDDTVQHAFNIYIVVLPIEAIPQIVIVNALESYFMGVYGKPVMVEGE